MKRLVWLSAGFCFFIIGLIGVIVPLLPTTPFMLLAAFAFARSSETLHQWLLTHPRFGSSIRDWNGYGIISRKTKYAAIGSILTTPFVSIILGLASHILIIQAIFLAFVAGFIISRPEQPPDSPHEN